MTDIQDEINHIRVNQPDLESVFSLEMSQLAQIYAIHHKDMKTCKRLIMQQLEIGITAEAVYRAGQKEEDDEQR